MDSPTSITNQTPKEKPIVITSGDSKKSVFKYSFVNPKILGAMTVLLLLVGGVGAGVYMVQKPQQTVSQASLTPVNINFQPAEVKAESGSDFNVDVFTTAGENKITGADLTIKYDPEVLTLKSITPKDFLPKILIPPKIASGSASISLGTDVSSGVSGNGIIASLLFTTTDSNSQTSSKISFDPSATQIRILNRNPEDANNSFGTATVAISSGIKPKASSSTAPTTISEASSSAQNPTDFNKDGFTNSIDLSIMYSAWGDPQTDTQKKADINGDGKVNGLDYSGLLPKFKQ